MITKSGVIIGYDRKTFMDEVRFWYGDETADAVLIASHPCYERLHVEQHRQAQTAEHDTE
jgi:hypothetical protein